MNQDHSEARNQIIAVTLIALALFAVAAADHWNWRDLANAGQTVLGFGGGILTGKYLITGKANPNDLPAGTKIEETSSVQTPPN